jgi:hypothetical protein
MKYRVLWENSEDGGAGKPFEIEGDTPGRAYFKAEEHIKGLSPYLKEHYSGVDIRVLEDELGKHHYPDIFLEDEKKTEEARKQLEKLVLTEREFMEFKTLEKIFGVDKPIFIDSVGKSVSEIKFYPELVEEDKKHEYEGKIDDTAPGIRYERLGSLDDFFRYYQLKKKSEKKK